MWQASKIVFGLLAGLLAAILPAAAQTTASLNGRVLDPLGDPLPAAEITVQNALTGYDVTALAQPDGSFQLTNIPLQTYRVTVTSPGFQAATRDVDLRTNVPVAFDVTLQVAAQQNTIVVSADAGSLVDATLTGTRTAVSLGIIERMPSATGSRGLESVLVSFPGFAQNANGAIHPRGAHNQMTFVVDGLPISDQLTGAFANALDTGIVQNVELMTGNIPAEFGSKVSGVAIVTTRSGLGSPRAMTGDVTVRVGQFDTAQAAAQTGGQRGRIGYFVTGTTMRTDRFLDQVSLDNLHNAGSFVRAFGRLDAVLAGGDLLRAYAMGGRSSFELANLRSQEASGQDQQQSLADASSWVSHLATLDERATLESSVAYRTATAALAPSAGDRPVTAVQSRRLSTLLAATRYTRTQGAHSIRAGGDIQRFPVRESFTLALTDAAFNDPASSDFNPALLAHDLTRGGKPFTFDESGAGTLVAAFAQDTMQRGRLTASVGLRFDEYRFLVVGRQWQPRIGAAWAITSSETVLRASYNRNYQTPPNENLLLSSSAAAGRLAPQSVRDALGGTHVPLQPERQDVVEAGVQQSVFGRASLDVSAYYKHSRDQQDNNNFFDTGIIFPTTLKELRGKGLEARLTVPPVRGVSGSLSVTMARAISTPPFTGGLFLGQSDVDLLTAGPFAIDHDQALSAHGTIHSILRGGFWAGGSVRYDSGLVANPSDPVEVAADADFADLLPYVDLISDVPRVRPRTVADAAFGYDARRGGQRVWSARLQVNNLTNQVALYNFQSVFVGTRVIQPRTVSAELRYYW